MTSHQPNRPTHAAFTHRARPWRRAALLVAAGLVAAAVGAPVSAQYRQEGGRALDANPRAGSGGRNDEAGSNAGSGTGSYVATSGAFVNDLRNRALNLGLDSTARPAELILSTFDQTNQPAYLTASPLQGVRVWDTGQNLSNFLITSSTGDLLRSGE